MDGPVIPQKISSTSLGKLLLLAGMLGFAEPGMAQTARAPGSEARPPMASPDFAQTAQTEGSGSAASSRLTLGNTPLSREPEILLLALRLRDLTLNDDMQALLDGQVLMLPLRDFAASLEFPIAVDAAAGRASGWFLSENRLFSLDLRRGLVILEGRESAFDVGLAKVFDNDIYLDIRLLAQWLPVDIRYNISELTAIVEPRERLPIDERLTREAYRQRVLLRPTDRSTLKKIELPYQAWSFPTVDVSTETTFRRSPSGMSGYGNYDLLAYGDLLWMNSEIYVSGDETSLRDARIKLQRKDPGGEALGPLQATEFGVGDISTPQIALVSNVQLGRGALVSNMPLDMPDEFDRITLDGSLPLGWEVELYRNGILLDFRTATADGRYVIPNVPLIYGVNVLRLVFYGPQGQRREEVRQVRVGTEQMSPGEVRYRFALAQHDERVFESLRNVARDARYGSERAMGNVMVGAADWLTLGMNFSTIPTLQGQQDYFGSTAILAIGNVLWRGDAVQQSETGGVAARLSAQTSVFGYSVLAEHNAFDQFRSENIGLNETAYLQSRSRLRTEGIFDLPYAVQIPLSLTLDDDRYEDGRRDLRLSNRLFFGFDRTSFSNTLNLVQTRRDGEVDRAVTGSFLVGGSLWDTRLRGQVNYEAAPDHGITAASLTFERPLNDRMQARFGVQHSFGDEPNTIYSAGVSHRFDSFYLGFRAEHDQQRNESLGLFTVSLSLGPDPVRGRPWISSTRSSDSGSFVGRMFLDKDSDGIYNPNAGDTPLPGTRLAVDGRPRGDRANEDGLVLLRGLPAYRETGIGIDRGSLGDPFLTASTTGVKVVPRPGTSAVHDFPVTTTGEIDGTVYRVVGDNALAVSGAIIQLLAEDGTVAREARSAYDGFYLFDFVPPGTYSIRIDPGQAKALAIRQQTDLRPEIKGDGAVVSNQNLIMIPE
ncbi:MAG: hypothetical protein ACK4NA_04555 [Alphaproteobacteria bacterium]